MCFYNISNELLDINLYVFLAVAQAVKKKTHHFVIYILATWIESGFDVVSNKIHVKCLATWESFQRYRKLSIDSSDSMGTC